MVKKKSRLSMALICMFIGAMVIILDGWPPSLPSYLPLQTCSPPLLHKSVSTKTDQSGKV